MASGVGLGLQVARRGRRSRRTFGLESGRSPQRHRGRRAAFGRRLQVAVAERRARGPCERSTSLVPGGLGAVRRRVAAARDSATRSARLRRPGGAADAAETPTGQHGAGAGRRSRCSRRSPMQPTQADAADARPRSRRSRRRRRSPTRRATPALRRRRRAEPTHARARADHAGRATTPVEPTTAAPSCHGARAARRPTRPRRARHAARSSSARREPARDDLRDAVAGHRDAVEAVGGLHRALLVGDDDELRAVGERRRTVRKRSMLRSSSAASTSSRM